MKFFVKFQGEGAMNYHMKVWGGGATKLSRIFKYVYQPLKFINSVCSLMIQRLLRNFWIYEQVKIE